MADHKPTSLGFTLALSAAFLFSTKPILIKWMYSYGITSLPLLGMRMLLAMPVYFVIGYVLWKRMENKPSRTIIVKAALIGLLGYYLASYLDLLGLEYVSAQLERLTLYAYPTFVVILGVIFFGNKLDQRIIPALILTYIGIAFLYGHDLNLVSATADQKNTTLGTLLILCSALSFALYVLLSKQTISKLGSLFFTCVSMTSASLATLIHYVIQEGAQFPQLNPQLWIGTSLLVVFATIIPTFMINEAIKRIGPEKVGISGTLGPVMTTIMAVVLLNEPFGLYTAIGMALVIFGVSWLQKK